MSAAVSAPVNERGVQAGIPDPDRVFVAQELALSTPELHLGRLLDQFESGPRGGKDPLSEPGTSLYHALSEALGTLDPGALRSRVMRWALETENLKVVASAAAESATHPAALLATLARSGNPGTEAGDLPARMIASTLKATLVITAGGVRREILPFAMDASPRTVLTVSLDPPSDIRSVLRGEPGPVEPGSSHQQP
jgi:hypothetical protein